MEAQQSGFHWERTSDGMSEPCPLGRGERYEVREDEIGRFKGMGSLREGGKCPEGIKGVGIIGPYERDIT